MTDSTETRECRGGGRKAGRAFRKTHTRTRLEADAVWLRKSCVEEGMSNRRDERSCLCCDCQHVRWVQREVGLERWAEAGSFSRAGAP